MADKEKTPKIEPVHPSPAPANATGSLVAATAVDAKPVAPVVDIDAAVDAWVDEHPAETSFTAEAPVADVTAKPQAADAVATPTDAQPTEQQPAGEAATVPVTDAAAKPDDKPVVDEKPADAAPAAPAAAAVVEQPKAIALDREAKFILAPGQPEWTGEQILVALQQRAAAMPKAEVADKFTKLFDVANFEQAEKAWSPILERLRAEPETTAFVDAFLADPAKAEYLKTCAGYYDDQNGTKTPPTDASKIIGGDPSKRPVDPVMAAENKRLTEYMDRHYTTVSTNRFNSEWAAATAKYPFLIDDKNAAMAVMRLASSLNGEDVAAARAAGKDTNEAMIAGRGVNDALALMAASLDARMIVLNKSHEAAPVQQVAPVVLGAGGAAPGGSRQPVDMKPKKFGHVDEGVDDWLSNTPPQFK